MLEKTGVKDEKVKMDPLSLIHPDDADESIRTIVAALRGEIDKMPYPLLVRAVKKGGGYQWIEIRFKEVMSLPMSQKELNFRKRLRAS